MTYHILLWLVCMCIAALLGSFLVATVMILVEAREAWRSHRSGKPTAGSVPGSGRARCACDSWVLVWDDAPLYHGGWLHETGRCYPDWEAVR